MTKRLMNTNQKLFLAINIIGGILVLGSYYLGLKGGKGTDTLWGGVPKNIRPIYTLFMLVCAIGYFTFFFYIMRGLGVGSISNTFFWGEKIFLILFAILLLFSSFWMPLVNLYISDPKTGIWVLVRIVLFVVALASIGIFIALLTVTPKHSGVFYYASLVGLFWFSIHTGVLDALLWPYLWGK